MSTAEKITVSADSAQPSGNIYNRTDTPCNYSYTPEQPFQVPTAAWVSFYLGCATFVLGVVGNSLCVIVMSRKAMRSSQFALYTSLLAVSDTAMLMIGFNWKLDYNWRYIRYNSFTCGFLMFLYRFAAHFSSWCLVNLSIDRFICIMYPLKYKEIVSRGKAVLGLLITAILLILINIQNIWTLYYDENEELCLAVESLRNSVYFYIVVWLDTTLFSLAPFIIIFTVNCISVYRLYIKQNPTKEITRKSRKLKGILLTLFGVSLAFITLSLPNCIVVLMSLIGGAKGILNQDITSYWYVITMGMEDFNFAINFYLYCLTGSKVRRELRRMFCGVRMDRSNTYLNTSRI